MTNMVERVAKAIHAADSDACPDDYNFGFYGPMALAAIEAMREPTEAMLHHGADQWLEYDPAYSDGPTMDEATGNCWQAMIDTALNEKGE